ncbi:hypothetical protein NX059_011843 [Plenodomus lindquistii]|nr:hypothetical protein NX059_011843 [Plenodomus lindquistii]
MSECFCHVARLRNGHWSEVKWDSRIFINFIAPLKDDAAPNTMPTKKKHKPRSKNKGKGKAENEKDEFDGPPPVDPAYRSHEVMTYETERIDQCKVDNDLMQALLAPMPGLHFGTSFTLLDDDTFATAGLLHALPDDDDYDMDMDVEDDFKQYENTVCPEDDWNHVLIL